MILVIGADGLIGGALFRHLQKIGCPVLATSRRKETAHLHLDLGNPEIFKLPKDVQTTVLCAATGGVSGCAQDPERTFSINVTGSLEIARRMAVAGSRVVFLSSNLVFDGQKGPGSIDTPLHPCCEYGRQKALLEAGLTGKGFACVRLTKIVETLKSRFSVWLNDLRAGREVEASSVLKFSPIALQDVIRGLSEIATSFLPGIFHISGNEEYTYQEAAVRIAKTHGLPQTLVKPDPSSGLREFRVIPRFSMLVPTPLPRCSDWKCSPSSVILDNFIRTL